MRTPRTPPSERTHAAPNTRPPTWTTPRSGAFVCRQRAVDGRSPRKLVDMQTCTTCGEESPATSEFFAPRGNGLRSQCRKCKRKVDKKWREEHAAELADYYQTYHQNNRAHRTAQMAENYAAAPQAYRVREAVYRKKNPGSEHARRARRVGREAAALGSFTQDEWIELCARYDNLCLACGSAASLTADHVVPLVKGGANDISNIQPLCRSCNSTKGTKIIDYRKANS